MGNKPNIVENTTLIANRVASSANIRSGASCYTTNSAINTININCTPSNDALQIIVDGFTQCLQITDGDSVCNDFYEAALQTQTCKFGNLTQVISYKFDGNCTISSTALNEMNSQMANDIAQELDNTTDIGALVLGAFSKSNTSNTVNIDNSLDQSFTSETHAESFSHTIAANTINSSGVGVNVDSITQESKVEASFAAYLASEAASNMASTIDNKSNQILENRVSGIFTAAEAWAGAFEAIGTGWTTGLLTIGLVIVIIVIGLPVVLGVVKGLSVAKKAKKMKKMKNTDINADEFKKFLREEAGPAGSSSPTPNPQTLPENVTPISDEQALSLLV